MSERLMAGWRRLPGSSRRYIGPGTPAAGISRRQYDKIAAAAGARKPLDIVAQAKNRVKTSRYKDLVADFITQKKSQGVVLKPSQARQSAEMKSIVKQLKAANKPAPKKLTGDALLNYRRAKNKKLLKILKELGRRDGLPDWLPVGFSDAYRRGKIVSPANLPQGWRL